jgi:hypothetical protein
MSQNSRGQNFSYYFCLMMEGSGSGYRSVPLTNGSGYGRRTFSHYVKDLELFYMQLAGTISYSIVSRHCKENLIYVFPEKKLRGLSPSFRIHVFAGDLYIPTIGLLIFPAAE